MPQRSLSLILIMATAAPSPDPAPPFHASSLCAQNLSLQFGKTLQSQSLGLF